MLDSLLITASADVSKTASAHHSYLNRRNFVKLAAAAGFGAFSLLAPSQAFAVTSAEKQAEADAVRRQMDEWDAQLAIYTTDYYNAMEAHDRAVANMEEAEGRIEAALQRQQELQSQLSLRVRTMYKQGPLSFMDVIFGSNSFIEFTTSWDLLSDINGRDAELIGEWRTACAEAEAARQEYAVQEQIALQKLAEAEEIQAQAQIISDAYHAELDGLEAEVRWLVEEERRAEEERQQRELEEARRRQQAEGGSSSSGGSPGGYVPYDGSSFDSIVEAAYSRLGCPYVWGATGPDSFDCSGLVYWCYRQAGYYGVPRTGDPQYYSAPMRMDPSEAEPGDILWKPGHVGICIGGDAFIHAPSPGYVVCIGTISRYPWVGAARW